MEDKKRTIIFVKLSDDQKLMTFAEELGLIAELGERDLKSSVEDMLTDISIVPEYFWQVPASSSGKYHNESESGTGGLVRHTKACVRVAVELFPLYNFCNKAKADIIAALILHDTQKYGQELEDRVKQAYSNGGCLCTADIGRSDDMHPTKASEILRRYADNKVYNDNGELYIISRMIRSHMGKWNKGMDEIMPKPKSEVEKFVHLCDYIASRRNITIDLYSSMPELRD